MKNYSLIANTQFKARSFDELIKPYVMYTQEYRTQEAALNELATKASVWEGLANEQTDPLTYAQYKNYSDSLKMQANIMATSGLNSTVRRNLNTLRERYASEMAPIEQAYVKKQAQEDEQRKQMLQNPTMMFSRRAGSTSLDEYVKNPSLSYEAYRGDLLTQQVGTAAAALAKELKDYGRAGSLSAQTKLWIEKRGFTSSQVHKAITDPHSPEASKVLTAIVEDAITNSGMKHWADNATMKQAYQWARQGLYQAIGEDKLHSFTDPIASGKGTGSGAELPGNPAGMTIPLQYSNKKFQENQVNKRLQEMGKNTLEYLKYIQKHKNNTNESRELQEYLKRHKLPQDLKNLTEEQATAVIKALAPGIQGNLSPHLTVGLKGHLKKSYNEDIVNAYINGREDEQYRESINANPNATRSVHTGKIITNSDKHLKDNIVKEYMSAYVQNGHILNTDPAMLAQYFGHYINTNNPAMYEIVDVDENGNFKKDIVGNMGELIPHYTDSNDQLKYNWGNITLASLGDDYLFSWVDEDNENHRYVVPKRMLSNEERSIIDMYDMNAANIMALLQNGSITADEAAALRQQAATQNLNDQYVVKQEVNVEKPKVTQRK